MIDCEFLGRTTVDLIYAVGSFPPEDAKIHAEALTVCAGGPAANAAAAFGFLGGRARLVTAIGAGPLAALAREDLRPFASEIVDLAEGAVYTPPISAVLTVASTASRTIVNSPLEAADSEFIAPTLSDAPKLALVDGYLWEATAPRVRRLRAAGAEIVADLGNLKPWTAEVIPLLDTAICGAAFRLDKGDGPEDVIDKLHRAGVARGAVSQGRRPILWSTGAGIERVEIEPVAAIDSLGAGDILHGGYCFARVKGADFGEALAFGAALASFSCRYRGTREWMGHWTGRGIA